MIPFLTPRLGMMLMGGALVALAAAALVDGISNRATIRTLEDARDLARDDLKAQSERLGICQGNYRSIETALDRQGKDIQDLSAQSATATAEAQRRLAEIAKQTNAAREASQRVLARPLPTPDNACTEAAKLLRGAM